MIIGICSICRGPVDDARNPATCTRCGAIRSTDVGTVIEMELPKPSRNQVNPTPKI